MENGLLLILLSTILVSLSGVMSPGPMTAAVIQMGASQKYSGVFLSLGHAVVEIPLIFSIYYGAGGFLQIHSVRIVVGILGGLFLFMMGMSLIKYKEVRDGFMSDKGLSPFYSGIVLSVGNPYFILWWATVGAGLIISVKRFGYIGLFLFIVFHWICDLVWYGVLSFASYKGMRILGHNAYQRVCFFCGLFMFFFSGVFIMSSLKLLIL
jgi:threonine/homoserine/homoserine lactone efflux protein